MQERFGSDCSWSVLDLYASDVFRCHGNADPDGARADAPDRLYHLLFTGGGRQDELPGIHFRYLLPFPGVRIDTANGRFSHTRLAFR